MKKILAISAIAVIIAFIFLRFSAIPVTTFIIATLFAIWTLIYWREVRSKFFLSLSGCLLIISFVALWITGSMASDRNAEARTLADASMYEESITAFLEVRNNYPLSIAAFGVNDEICATYFLWGASLVESQKYKDALEKFEYLNENYSDFRQAEVAVKKATALCLETLDEEPSLNSTNKEKMIYEECLTLNPEVKSQLCCKFAFR